MLVCDYSQRQAHEYKSLRKVFTSGTEEDFKMTTDRLPYPRCRCRMVARRLKGSNPGYAHFLLDAHPQPCTPFKPLGIPNQIRLMNTTCSWQHCQLLRRICCTSEPTSCGWRGLHLVFSFRKRQGALSSCLSRVKTYLMVKVITCRIRLE